MAEDPLARARAHAPAQAPAPSEAVPAGSVPLTQPAGPRETPPRRRGRPPGSKTRKPGRPMTEKQQAALTKLHEQQRAGRMLPGPKRGVTQGQERQVKAGLTLAIAGSDALAGVIFREQWTAEDRLRAEETTLLVTAIYAELETFPRALLWLASAAEAGVHVQLAWAVAMIAAPRLARRGVIPPELANALAFAPVFMAAGSTPGSDRANGDGEVNASGVVAPESPVQNGAKEQAGYGAL